MTVSGHAVALNTRVFSAAEQSFTWAQVIEAARVRGDWASLQHHALGLLAREQALIGSDGLPSSAQVQTACNAFRYEHNLLSADELMDWLGHHDVTLDEWRRDMQLSLLEPADPPIDATSGEVDRICWVHAMCSGKLGSYARVFAEEVAVHFSQGALTLASDELAGLAQEHKQFCVAQLGAGALAAEIENNKLNWTRVDMRCLVHRNEMIVREAAMCVRLDGRDIGEVVVDAGMTLRHMNLLLDDVDPALRTRLLAADPGDLVGPVTIEADHWLVLMMGRVAPSLDDPALRDRAEDTIINRALESEVNRFVTWHEYF